VHPTQIRPGQRIAERLYPGEHDRLRIVGTGKTLKYWVGGVVLEHLAPQLWKFPGERSRGRQPGIQVSKVTVIARYPAASGPVNQACS
jgi:hypothetical protein